jgi:hypothetical protein
MPALSVIKLRRGEAQAWTDENPILALGEPGYETDTGKLKIGDGSSNWNSLPYFDPVSGKYQPLDPELTALAGLTPGANLLPYFDSPTSAATTILTPFARTILDDANASEVIATIGAIPSSEKGSANGVATLDGSGKVPVSQLPSAIMTYEGLWNASTNNPTLADGTGDAGQVYRVSVAGTQNLGSGNITFDVGDYVIYNGTVWEKSDTTDSVVSVNGSTGIVTVNAINQLTGDVTTTVASGSESKVATIANGAVTGSKIANNTITDANINANAAIAESKLALDHSTSSLNAAIATKQPLDPTLTALAAYNTNGLLVQTAPDTFTGRAIVAADAKISVINGDGVSGNPTIGLGSTTGSGNTVVLANSPQITTPQVSNGITTGDTTFNLVNTTATTVNFAGAATTINIGSVTGNTTINNGLTVGGILVAAHTQLVIDGGTP